MIASVLGYKARFCNAGCRAAFKTDRQAGLNYGLHRFNGVTCMHREEWSLVACQCAYCNAAVPGRIPARLREKFQIGSFVCNGVTFDSLADATEYAQNQFEATGIVLGIERAD